jgi:hypothetical protein
MARGRASGVGGGRSKFSGALRMTGLLLGLAALLSGVGWSVLSLVEGPSDVSLVTTAFVPAAASSGAQCLPVRMREASERESCFHRIQRELYEGWVDLDEAVRRLESCASAPSDLDPLLQRHASLRVERYRARVAFGQIAEPRGSMENRLVAEQAGSGFSPPSAGAVMRLRRAGITSFGLVGDDPLAVVLRLRDSGSLRRDFREVFGPLTAADLENVLTPTSSLGSGGGHRPDSTATGGEHATSAPAQTAAILGNSVILRVPETVYSPSPASLSGSPAGGASSPGPLVVLDLAEYTDRIVDDLDRLEAARLRYLESAGELYRMTGSIEKFVESVRHRERAAGTALAAERAAADRAAMLARLRELEFRNRLDPALVALARGGISSTEQLSRACEVAALRSRHRIRTGAGVVAGLGGAAVAVVAGGVTGTLIGGVTIAAALQAAGGSYLALRSERIAARDVGAVERPRPEIPREEEKRFQRRDRLETLARGDRGAGQGDSEEEDDRGSYGEGQGGSGDGAEFDDGDDDFTVLEPRENSVPALLPPALDEAALELPPMLTAEALRELKPPSLSEAQERIDEFLALDAGDRITDRATVEIRASAAGQLIEEAREALRLWVEERQLSRGFGEFFLRAEVEQLPESRRAEAMAGAGQRFASDMQSYGASSSLEDLRARLARRLVIHCRGGMARGDLVLQACADPTALTLVVIAAIQESGLAAPTGSVLGVQAKGTGFEPVLYREGTSEVLSLSSGETVRGVVAPIYHPASFYYSFLVERGVRPGVDPEEHLLIARADPALAALEQKCEEQRRGLARAMDWLRRMVGLGVPSRRGAGCGDEPGAIGAPADESRTADSGRDDRGGGVHLSIRRPSLPRPGGGGGQAGGGEGGSGGGGGGGGSEGRAAGGQGPGAGGASGDAARGGAAGGGANGSEGSEAGASSTAGDGQGGGREGSGDGQGSGSASGGAGGRGSSSATGSASNAIAGDGGQVDGGSDAGTAAAAGRDAEGGAGGESLDLHRVARESVALGSAAREDGPLRLRPWRLREDFSFFPQSGRVYYADNEHARARFRPDDRFITMSPSVAEGQRRMFEADSFPVFAAATECGARGLPPRRVFRRATGIGDAFRYVFCDQDESMVAFRTREDAARYGRLAPADRPLLLTRLASERIARFQESPEMATIHAFLRDPDILRTLPTAELDSLVTTAGELLWLHETLESSLFLSMGELEGSAIRSYYYDLHRQVAQSAFIVDFVQAVYRFNQRLASDPLRTLAWANALPPEHRQRFFRLYFTLGGPMYWPQRWEALHRRYAVGAPVPPASDSPANRPSHDFLQIMSDPTRVQVDWRAERPPSRASIRDRRPQQGAERTDEIRREASEEEERERQETVTRRRGGTLGLGRTGEGEGLGPEQGRRPLQMIHVRVRPETGDPDRPRLPENNPTRPGGTEGKRRVQEESATRQEPALWVAPRTFVDAILSGWEPPRSGPGEAERVPPAVRFSPRLREVFLSEPDEDRFYESRIAYAVSILGTGGWLRYAEVRDAMGGEWQAVRAFDTGRFASELSRNAAIVDQAQVRGPNYFTRGRIDVPADLLGPVRESFSRHGNGSFDLRRMPANDPVRLPPVSGDSREAAASREQLLRSLQIIADQMRSRD